MSDRELLELAAKAYGVVGEYLESDTACCIFVREENRSYFWNPLTDDGDALRLAVKLHLFDAAFFYSFRSLELLDKKEKDWLTATRRAIVRAAAEFGRRMQHE